MPNDGDTVKSPCTSEDCKGMVTTHVYEESFWGASGWRCLGCGKLK